jgi:hypothetical protein
VRADGLAAERRHLARRVLALQCGEVEHGHRELQAKQLRPFLNAARGVFGDPLLDADGVDGSDLADKAAERGMNGRGHGGKNIHPNTSENNAKVHSARTGNRRQPAGRRAAGRGAPALPEGNARGSEAPPRTAGRVRIHRTGI